jgi:hypothetical protein
MNTSDPGAGSSGGAAHRVIELSTAECWSLLRGSHVGRLAWTTTGGPVVVPVNLVLDGRSVRIRTSAHSEMVGKVDDERVAVQVDAFDELRRSGWSVLARGVARVRYDDVDGPEPDLWPTDPRPALVVVTIDELTGRKLVSAAPGG